MKLFSNFRLNRRGAIQCASWMTLAATAVLIADYQPPEQQLPPTDYPPTTAMSQPVDSSFS